MKWNLDKQPRTRNYSADLQRQSIKSGELDLILNKLTLWFNLKTLISAPDYSCIIHVLCYMHASIFHF